MKNILTFILLCGVVASYAQNKSLGVGTATPNANAALHVESPTNNQGFIMPRLTTVQRIGMGSLLTTADNGLMLYDTDLKTIYIWDGAAWKNTAQVAEGNRLTYPYKDSVTTTLTGNDVFALKYNNAANKRVLRVESLSATNGSSAVSVQQNGTGIGIFSRVDNPAAGTSAVFGTTNSNLGGAVAPVGIYGESTGTGSLGAAFRVNNAANTFPAVYAETNGSGSAARINALNAASAAPALEVLNAGTGNAIQTTGKIQAGQFIGNGSLLTNVTATNPRLTLPYQDSVLTAPANASLLRLYYGGTAPGNVGLAYFENLNPTNSFGPLFVRTLGIGSASNFFIVNAASNGAAVGGTTNGTGQAIRGLTTGTGQAGTFTINNAANTAAAIVATTNGSGAAIFSQNTGSANGFAGNFNSTQATNTFPAIQASTVGTGPGVRVLQNASSLGSGMDVIMQNTTGTAIGFSVNQQGLGGGANFSINNGANTSAALVGTTTGTGAAIQGTTATGFAAVYGRRDGATNGHAGLFEITNAANTFPALQANTVGTGAAGNFKITNSASTVSAVIGETNGALTSAGVYGLNTGGGFGVVGRSTGSALGSAAVYGEQLGTGDAAGAFRINNAANVSSAVYGETNGSGSTIFGAQLGLGRAGQFQINNASNTESAIRGFTNGTGRSGFFTVSNPLNSSEGLYSATNGTGNAGKFEITNTGNAQPALQAQTNGTGSAISAINNGIGYGIFARAVGANDAIYGIKQAGDGGGSAGNFQNQEPTNIGSALFALTNAAGGYALGALNNANGNAFGIFQGGIQLSVAPFAAPGTITAKAVVYELSGSGSVSLPVGGSAGETCWVYNPTASPIIVESVPVANATVRQFIKFAGGWKIVN